MPDAEKHRHEEHQGRIEDVQVVLVLEEYSISSHNIFDDSEYRSDHDESTCDIENNEMSLPRDGNGGRLCGGNFANADVEDGGDDDEEAEDED